MTKLTIDSPKDSESFRAKIRNWYWSYQEEIVATGIAVALVGGFLGTCNYISNESGRGG